MLNWYGEVSDECFDVIRQCRAYNPDCQPPSDLLPFTGMTVNIGTPDVPGVATGVHLDCMNFPFCPCAIYATGNHDHKKGGHLVLHDVKKVVEFPSGCTIFIPSAVLRHSNVPVQGGEIRRSFTAYTAGGLIRFVRAGFKLLHGERIYNKNVSWSTLVRVGDERVVVKK